ncbi:MAG TPA: hypothetical protein VHB51_01440 [Candidatus Saccharimonadales bacterium]|nr:hypothetical protein [Candidatus Saccharimonadales bacterium]
MNSKRLYYVLLGLIVLLFIGLVGGAYEINAMLQSKSTKLVDLRAKQQADLQEETELVAAKRDIKNYTSLYKIAQVVVPQNKDQTQAVRQIVALADKNNVQLASIDFPPSTLGGSASKGAAAAPAVSAQSGAVSLSQLKPVTGIPGVYSLDLTVTSDSSHPCTYSQFINFLSDLEQNRLTALVSSIDITPGGGSTSSSTKSDPNRVSFALTLDIYIKPENK